MTLTNAIPTAALCATAAEPSTGHFVFIARLDKEHRWKGLEHVLQAFVFCPEAFLRVVGDGDLRPIYEKMAVELGVADRVAFLGTVTGPAKDRLIRTSVALIAYPTTSNDAFPTVLLEAWANRTPVVAAEIGALRTLVRPGIDGHLVAPARPQALAGALRALMDDSAHANRLGESGRLRVAEMTWDRQAARFEDVAESLLVARWRKPRHSGRTP